MNLNNDQEILQSVVKKAWKDPAFKSSLIQNPVVTIENFLGHPINLPTGKNLAFVDQTDSSTIFVNIPAELDMEDMELDEDQLDVISGGTNDGDPPIYIKPVNSGDNIFGGN
ncbi:hypothetical protein J3D55_004316 [Chryseobacterium ginsenosidimutans]|jgi:hypothetical protein|uniref:hypothetical protein n=1 Tax=Chryseobacterium ginsenosidimutans TaxID=687846 RepID=UPI0021673805|nr:hypothetical protein [Chryseobacterium ginsenosidimutans]MCS3871400.1 hypothetical protein [Chryseobacterium ginsenosidimutans]